MEISWSVYGLPQAGAHTNKGLKENFAPHGYLEVTHTPRLCQHGTRPIFFYLVVDGFGVKKKHYEIPEDWTGGLYFGITLRWNYNRYIQKLYVDISMPGYIKKIAKIPTQDIKTPPTFIISLSPQEIRISITRTNTIRWLQYRCPRRNQTRSKNSWQHPLICKILWSSHSHGTIDIGEWTI